MKCAAITSALIALAVAAPTSALSQVSSENLLGTWSGTMSGFFGAKAVEPQQVKFMIEKTNGRAFEGISQYEDRDGKPTNVVFNGFIAPDGDGWATNRNGYFDLRLEPDGELHVIFRDADPQSGGPITMYGVFKQ